MGALSALSGLGGNSAVFGGAVLAPPSDNITLWLKAYEDTYQSVVGGEPAVQNGDPIGYWVGSHGAVQSTSTSKRPTLRLNAKNGLPFVRWDGIDDSLVFNGTLFNGAGGTIYVVVSGAASMPGAQNILDTATDSNTNRRAMNYVTSTSMRVARDGTGGGFAQATGLTAGGWQLVAGVINGSGSYIQVNGGVPGTGIISSAVSSNGNPYALGARYTQDAFFLNGGIGEIIVYNVAHTPEQVGAATQYLNSKWAVY